MTPWLAPHPWDSVGPPPPPIAPTYDAADRKSVIEDVVGRIERLVEDVEDAEERARELEDDADDERMAADKARDDVLDLIEGELRPVDVALADEWLAKVKP